MDCVWGDFRHEERCHDDEPGGRESILEEVADVGYAAVKGGWKLWSCKVVRLWSCKFIVNR